MRNNPLTDCHNLLPKCPPTERKALNKKSCPDIAFGTTPCSC